MSLLKVVAKYKSKKKLDTGTVVYEYSEKQIAKRHKEKADRIEKLRGSIEKLRTQVMKDIKSDDPETKLKALAVALMDHTYERVGNDESADDGHFGVTGWQKRHVTFGKGKATIKYVGKSGVKHEKEVTDKAILKALKDAHENAKGEKTCLFEYDGGCVTASEVNHYLKEYDITAKDLRGFHANDQMKQHLQKIRSGGGKLPEDKKEREKKLKDEFKEALEMTAEEVGHEASTLRSQYLVPALEENYLKDGSVLEKLNAKTADMDSPAPPLTFANRMIRMFVDHGLGEQTLVSDNDFMVIRTAFSQAKGDWERIHQGDPVQLMLLSTLVNAWASLPGRKPETESV